MRNFYYKIGIFYFFNNLFSTKLLSWTPLKSPPQPLPPPPIFLTKNGTGGWNRSLTKNTKNGTEREDHSLTKNGTEWYGMEREPNNWKTKERERNDLAEGHLSRTQRNGLKKVCVQP